jgi:hypothetical protein
VCTLDLTASGFGSHYCVLAGSLQLSTTWIGAGRASVAGTAIKKPGPPFAHSAGTDDRHDFVAADARARGKTHCLEVRAL